MSDFAYALGRAMLAIIFIVAGVGKFINVAGVASVLAAHDFPLPVVFGYATAALELIGGVGILLGYQARWAALVLLVFTAGATVISHHFWDMDGLERVRNQTQALKNLAIMGGFLLIAAGGPGRFSLDRLFGK
jgi:putative oxidoreductase